MSKIDKSLGKEVQDHLVSLGIATPWNDNGVDNETKKELISEKVREILDVMGMDLNDDSIEGTPDRVAKMYVDEIFKGLSTDNFPKATTVQNKMTYSEMILVKDINVMSACEHHLVTIDGVAQVAYIPKDKVLGLSKINRIVDYFSRRPQIQERLTLQVGEALKYILETDDVAVTIDAAHYCVKSRGVEDQESRTRTSFLSGSFRENQETRLEYFSGF